MTTDKLIDIKVTLPITEYDKPQIRHFINSANRAVQSHLAPLGVEDVMLTFLGNECKISFILNGYSQVIRQWLSADLDTVLAEYIRALKEQP